MCQQTKSAHASLWVHDKNPDGKVHGANMGPTWVLSASYGPILAPWNLLSGKPLNGRGNGQHGWSS